MEPNKESDEPVQERVKAQREGSAAGLVAGLMILMLLAGSVILVSYFWPLFHIAATQPSGPEPPKD